MAFVMRSAYDRLPQAFLRDDALTTQNTHDLQEPDNIENNDNTIYSDNNTNRRDVCHFGVQL